MKNTELQCPLALTTVVNCCLGAESHKCSTGTSANMQTPEDTGSNPIPQDSVIGRTGPDSMIHSAESAKRMGNSH